MLLQYGIDGQLLTAIKSLFMHSEVGIGLNSATTKPFRVSVGLGQGCSLLPILFLIDMDRTILFLIDMDRTILFLIDMDRIAEKSEFCDGVKIGDCTVKRLLFAYDLVLLKWSPASS